MTRAVKFSFPSHLIVPFTISRVPIKSLCTISFAAVIKCSIFKHCYLGVSLSRFLLLLIDDIDDVEDIIASDEIVGGDDY